MLTIAVSCNLNTAAMEWDIGGSHTNHRIAQLRDYEKRSDGEEVKAFYIYKSIKFTQYLKTWLTNTYWLTTDMDFEF